MSLDPAINFGKVEVSAGYNSTVTSIVLASGDGAKLPSTFSYNMVWWNSTDFADPADDTDVEVVRVSAGPPANTVTIARAQEGTSASAKNIAGKTYKMILALTNKMIDDIAAGLINTVTTTSSIELTKTGGSLSATVVANGIKDTHIDWGEGVGQVSARDIPMATIAGSTFSTLQHLQDVFHSAGWVSGGGITDDADGTITVAAGTGLIRATDSATAEILYFDWSAEAGANVALVDNDINYVYAEYNSGSPQVVARTTLSTDFHTDVLLAIISREGTTLHINEKDRHEVGDHANNMIRRLKATMPYGHESGAIISAPSGVKIAVTAGTFWRGLTRFATSAVDTSVAGTFSYYYNDGSWQKTATQTDIDNTQYNNFGTGLANLSNNKYGVHWIYKEADDEDLAIVYGIGDYTLVEAEDAGIPSAVPQHLEVEGILIGKIIIKKSDAAFTQLESAFTSTFQGSIATDHGNLAGLADVADHAYALLHDGTRALSGAWNMGSNTVTNANLEAPVLGTPNTVVLTNATGLPVAGLAAGVDGELITWNAAGLAATVGVGTVTQVLTSNGPGAAPTFQAPVAGIGTIPIFSVHKNGTNQTGVVTATFTKLTWSTEKFDTNNDFASDKFSPTVAGKYKLFAQARIIDPADGVTFKISIYDKGGVDIGGNQIHSSHVDGLGVGIDVIVDADGSTDFYEVYVRHTHGSDRVISGPANETFFNGFKIAE